MRPARHANHFMKEINVAPFISFDMRTTDNVKNEIYGSIEFISEIEEVGKAVLQKHGQTKNLQSTFMNMQAFVRQSKTFFNSAETLDFRSSPLIYYYSFLNLAKAFITTIEPEKASGHVFHGIITAKSSAPEKNIIEVRNGIFSDFYRLITGQNLPTKTRLNIFDLLGYCSDVGLEYQIGGFGQHRITSAKFRIAGETPSGPYYGILAIQNFEKLEPFNKTLTDFYKHMEEVDLNKNICKNVFEIYAEQKANYRFFETRNTYTHQNPKLIPTGEIAVAIYDSVKAMFEHSVYIGGGDFNLVTPLRSNFQAPMRELTSIYAIMFYLGSLVRYNPAHSGEDF